MKDYEEERQIAKRMHDNGLTAEEHLRRAERLLAGEEYSDGYWRSPDEYDLDRAKTHAAIAKARAAIEARTQTIGEPGIRPAVPR